MAILSNAYNRKKILPHFALAFTKGFGGGTIGASFLSTRIVRPSVNVIMVNWRLRKKASRLGGLGGGGGLGGDGRRCAFDAVGAFRHAGAIGGPPDALGARRWRDGAARCVAVLVRPCSAGHATILCEPRARRASFVASRCAHSCSHSARKLRIDSLRRSTTDSRSAERGEAATGAGGAGGAGRGLESVGAFLFGARVGSRVGAARWFGFIGLPWISCHSVEGSAGSGAMPPSRPSTNAVQSARFGCSASASIRRRCGFMAYSRVLMISASLAAAFCMLSARGDVRNGVRRSLRLLRYVLFT